MDQERVTAEISELLESLKTALAERGVATAGTSGVAAAAEISSPETLPPLQDTLPDHRSLRRFLLMV